MQGMVFNKILLPSPSNDTYNCGTYYRNKVRGGNFCVDDWLVGELNT